MIADHLFVAVACIEAVVAVAQDRDHSAVAQVHLIGVTLSGRGGRRADQYGIEIDQLAIVAQQMHFAIGGGNVIMTETGGDTLLTGTKVDDVITGRAHIGVVGLHQNHIAIGVVIDLTVITEDLMAT